MTALQILNRESDKAKATKYPNVPSYALVKSNYNNKSANALTRAIVDYMNLHGYYSTRLASTGIYRPELQKFVPSQQRNGMPDIFAVVRGRAVFVEVKFGDDRLSNIQKHTISDLIAAGAVVYIARDFQGFYDWFTALELTITDAEVLPFGPPSTKL